MKYTVFQQNREILKSDDLDILKECLISLALKNKEVFYSVREEGYPIRDAARFTVKFTAQQDKQGNATKRDLLVTSEYDGTAINVKRKEI